MKIFGISIKKGEPKYVRNEVILKCVKNNLVRLALKEGAKAKPTRPATVDAGFECIHETQEVLAFSAARALPERDRSGRADNPMPPGAGPCGIQFSGPGVGVPFQRNGTMV